MFDVTSLVVPPVVSTPVPTPGIVPPIVPPLVPALATVLPSLPQPGNTWPAVTHLVVGDDGRLQQSAQNPEINKCISKAVRLMHSKIYFDNAFPGLEDQNKWLSESLSTVLQDQARTDLVVREVNFRAQQDRSYMSALLSMVRCRLPLAALTTENL